ncbi:hypothetical protein B5S32_g4631 [[Candida] boidinii]|nr:hypothetical protein B5S32_g4631 [[Candida] boidinii]
MKNQIFKEFNSKEYKDSSNQLLIAITEGLKHQSHHIYKEDPNFNIEVGFMNSFSFNSTVLNDFSTDHKFVENQDHPITTLETNKKTKDVRPSVRNHSSSMSRFPSSPRFNSMEDEISEEDKTDNEYDLFQFNEDGDIIYNNKNQIDSVEIDKDKKESSKDLDDIINNRRNSVLGNQDFDYGNNLLPNELDINIDSLTTDNPFEKFDLNDKESEKEEQLKSSPTRYNNNQNLLNKPIPKSDRKRKRKRLQFDELISLRTSTMKETRDDYVNFRLQENNYSIGSNQEYTLNQFLDDYLNNLSIFNKLSFLSTIDRKRLKLNRLLLEKPWSELINIDYQDNKKGIYETNTRKTRKRRSSSVSSIEYPRRELFKRRSSGEIGEAEYGIDIRDIPDQFLDGGELNITADQSVRIIDEDINVLGQGMIRLVGTDETALMRTSSGNLVTNPMGLNNVDVEYSFNLDDPRNSRIDETFLSGISMQQDEIKLNERRRQEDYHCRDLYLALNPTKSTDNNRLSLSSSQPGNSQVLTLTSTPWGQDICYSTKREASLNSKLLSFYNYIQSRALDKGSTYSEPSEDEEESVISGRDDDNGKYRLRYISFHDLIQSETAADNTPKDLVVESFLKVLELATRHVIFIDEERNDNQPYELNSATDFFISVEA